MTSSGSTNQICTCTSKHSSTNNSLEVHNLKQYVYQEGESVLRLQINRWLNGWYKVSSRKWKRLICLCGTPANAHHLVECPDMAPTRRKFNPWLTNAVPNLIDRAQRARPHHQIFHLIIDDVKRLTKIFVTDLSKANAISSKGSIPRNASEGLSLAREKR